MSKFSIPQFLYTVTSICDSPMSTLQFLINYRKWFDDDDDCWRRVRVPKTWKALHNEYREADKAEEKLFIFQSLPSYAYKMFMGQPQKSTQANPSYVYLSSDNKRILVFGDFHGDFESFLKAVFIAMQKLENGEIDQIVFDGDYVDRGACSLEVFVGVCVLQRFNPKIVTATRGNHEEDIDNCKEFKQEIQNRFCGSLNGFPLVFLFSAVQCVFDTLPYFIRTEDKHFIVHGGLPVHEYSFVDNFGISQVCKLSNPEDLFHPRNVISYLWSDPLSAVCCNPPQPYFENDARGAGFIYSEAAIDVLNQKTEFKIEEVTRGHQTKRDQTEATLWKGHNTIFSSGNMSSLAWPFYSLMCTDPYFCILNRDRETQFESINRDVETLLIGVILTQLLKWQSEDSVKVQSIVSDNNDLVVRYKLSQNATSSNLRAELIEQISVRMIEYECFKMFFSNIETVGEDAPVKCHLDIPKYLLSDEKKGVDWFNDLCNKDGVINLTLKKNTDSYHLEATVKSDRLLLSFIQNLKSSLAEIYRNDLKRCPLSISEQGSELRISGFSQQVRDQLQCPSVEVVVECAKGLFQPSAQSS